jgi:hypothetical protein
MKTFCRLLSLYISLSFSPLSHNVSHGPSDVDVGKMAKIEMRHMCPLYSTEVSNEQFLKSRTLHKDSSKRFDSCERLHSLTCAGLVRDAC